MTSSTKASAIHDNGTQEWLASHDTDPLDTAVVYNSLKGDQCGHELLWHPLVRSLESKTTLDGVRCAVCQLVNTLYLTNKNNP